VAETIKQIVLFQVRTLFVSGLPMDAKPRELYLLFRAYEVSKTGWLEPVHSVALVWKVPQGGPFQLVTRSRVIGSQSGPQKLVTRISMISPQIGP
jgi:hypothetical protein